MNIEIANRLIQLRKKCGYSQEELASKLGLSRQSVSKWERAEASPDTDNLIELAKLYNISLDDLLNTDVNLDDVINKAEKNPHEGSDVNSAEPKQADAKSTVKIDSDGIYVRDGDDEVYINGGCVSLKDGDEGLTINKGDRKLKTIGEIITGVIGAIVLTGYLLFGFLYSDHAFAWKVGWTALLLVPVFGSIFECARKHRVHCFSYPLLVTAIYCFTGLAYGIWHPTWILFITIAVFYGVASPIDKVLADKYPPEIRLECNDKETEEE